MEELTAYLPQAVKVLGIFCSGFFGNRLYQKRRNGNNRYRQLGECELLHEGINDKLKEGNERMGRMEITLKEVNDNVMVLKGAHEGK